MLDEIKSPEDLKKIPVNKLKDLCSEIREKIISVMTRNGGHLASNLGVVELTTAIHYVFKTPDDMIIFDVGHQCYTHKILTGRNREFETIRIKDGLSGFPRKKESVYDPVDSGHSSTSISSAAGFAMANKLNGGNSHIVVVIGDGALSGGEAFEGLNYIGHLDLPMVVILNDNEMSISKNVGSISRHIGKLTVSKPYQKLTDIYHNIMKKKKGPLKFLFWFAKKFEKGLKLFLGYENIFLNLGFEYIGPIDGHNLDELVYILKEIRANVKRPVLLHVKTVKGKGFSLAEVNPTKFHGVTPKMMSGEKMEVKDEKTFTDVFADKIVDLGEKHSEVVAITAAMGEGTGLIRFRDKYPERFFDVGIAEQHAVTFCGGLSIGGLKPVFAVYSTFLQRAIDQIIQDICISGIPAIFAIDRAGIVGSDGETHQGVFDLTYLKMIPNMNILVPCDAAELQMMMEYAYQLDRPAAIRYPRDHADESQTDFFHPPVMQNPYLKIMEGGSLLVIVVGPFVKLAREALEEIREEFNVECGLIYLRIIKPLPEEGLLAEISKYRSLLVIEENVLSGSFSEEISSLLLRRKIDVDFDSINLPDYFIEHDTRKNLLNKLGYNRENMVRLAKGLLKQRIKV
jgi:1-deoxy-D-xylulose-5-phosphate synthase